MVTGNPGGAKHIGNLTKFFVAVGPVIPPFGNLTVLWFGLAKKSKKSGL